MIEIIGLSKRYKTNDVLDRLDLCLEKDQVYCLLGKNGVGKTTLLNLVLDLARPTEGIIKIFGKSNSNLKREDKRRIGFVGESLALIEEISAYQFLEFIGKIYQIPAKILKQRILELLDYFFEDISELDKNMSKYSTGMKKKVAFCAAVIHLPDVLILDEPFSGLDPFVANQMVSFINKYMNAYQVITSFLSDFQSLVLFSLASNKSAI